MRTGRDGHSSAAMAEHKINALVTAAAQSRFIGFSPKASIATESLAGRR
jgi:hypothetical protein